MFFRLFFSSSQGPRAVSIEMPHARRQSLHHCHLEHSHQKAMPSANPKSCGRRRCYCVENANYGQCTCESQLQMSSRLWSTAWYWLTYSEQQEDKAENSSKQCVWVKKWRIEAQKHVTYAEIQVLAANKILQVPTAMHVPSVTIWWAKSWGMSEARRNKAMRLWISCRLNSWHVLAL